MALTGCGKGLAEPDQSVLPSSRENLLNLLKEIQDKMGNAKENVSLRSEGSVSGGESQLQLCRELWGAGERVPGVAQDDVGGRQ